ncbi:MAG: tetraacyldisaccharide 4'-kinase, partial [Rubrivivax sp.]
MALQEALQRAWWRPRVGGLAVLLWPLTVVYRLLRWLNEAPWRWGWRNPWRAPVPVLVVGNLVVGGAGKTPTVIALAQALQRRGWKPGIVSRGYGSQRPDAEQPAQVRHHSQAAQIGDEPLLMALRTGLPGWVCKRRVAAAQALCAHHPEVDVLISDDGLQHMALHRDAELLVLWTAVTPDRLSKRAAALVSSRDVQSSFSMATLWEVAIKTSLDKPG